VGDRAASTFVISLTPFRSDGSLDEEGLRGHFQRLAAAGIGVYVGGSGSGEGYTLSDQEVVRVLEIAMEELHEKVPTRAMGREPRTAAEMIAFGKLVQSIGLHGTQIYSLDIGHGNKPSDLELQAYLEEVLSSLEGPCILSIHQSVGYLYPIDLVLTIVERYPNIIGVNVSTSDIQYIARLTEAIGGKIEIHCGGPAHALTTLALGGTGYLSSEGNLAPQLCVSLVDEYNAGNHAGAESAYRKILSLWPITYRYGSIRGTKAALQMLQLPGGYPRRPRLPVPENAIPEIATKLRALDIPELRELIAGLPEL